MIDHAFKPMEPPKNTTTVPRSLEQLRAFVWMARAAAESAESETNAAMFTGMSTAVLWVMGEGDDIFSI